MCFTYSRLGICHPWDCWLVAARNIRKTEHFGWIFHFVPFVTDFNLLWVQFFTYTIKRSLMLFRAAYPYVCQWLSEVLIIAHKIYDLPGFDPIGENFIAMSDLAIINPTSERVIVPESGLFPSVPSQASKCTGWRGSLRAQNNEKKSRHPNLF